MSKLETLKQLFALWKEWIKNKNNQEINIKMVIFDINEIRNELLDNKIINIEFPEDEEDLGELIIGYVFGVRDDNLEANITKYADYWLEYKNI